MGQHLPPTKKGTRSKEKQEQIQNGQKRIRHARIARIHIWPLQIKNRRGKKKDEDSARCRDRVLIIRDFFPSPSSFLLFVIPHLRNLLAVQHVLSWTLSPIFAPSWSGDHPTQSVPTSVTKDPGASSSSPFDRTAFRTNCKVLFRSVPHARGKNCNKGVKIQDVKLRPRTSAKKPFFSTARIVIFFGARRGDLTSLEDLFMSS